MRIDLADVNVLLALIDPVHVHHEGASQWFVDASARGWATCPLTENGFVRILSNPSYPGLITRPLMRAANGGFTRSTPPIGRTPPSTPVVRARFMVSATGLFTTGRR